MNQQILEQNDSTTQNLKELWGEYRQQHPKSRIRDAANALNVSEVELLATHCGNTVRRLCSNWQSILSDMNQLATVMALTRNNHVVHEQTGQYENLQFSSDDCHVTGKNISLKLFLNQWHSGFAVQEQSPRGNRSSLQFFDNTGMAVHKIYLTPKSNQTAYQALANKYQAEDQSPIQSVSKQSSSCEKEEIDYSNLLRAWRAMENSNEIHHAIEVLGVTELQVIRKLDREFAFKVSPDVFANVMATIVDDKMPIKIVVKNKGAMQSHNGAIKTIRTMGKWFNILDNKFSLHLNEETIASLWVVKKPLADGWVTSLELFDLQGEHMISIYHPQGDCPGWCKILASLPSLDATEIF